MHSIILKTASKLLIALMLAFSLFILLRGHHEPGGGFIGGLMAACALALYVMVYGTKASQRFALKLPYFIVSGLLCALLSGIIAMFNHLAFLTATWWYPKELPVALGTPLLFELGIYLVVFGSVAMMMFALEEKA